MSALLHGPLALAANVEVRKLLLVGAITGTLGLAIGCSGIRPELLQGQVTDLFLLFLADALKMEAATFLGLAL